MSIMLINFFLFLGNWTALKSMDISYCAQNTTFCDHSTAAQLLILLLC